MDTSQHNLNPDGNNMTTPAEPGTLTEGYVTETMDGQTMTTEAMDGQNVVNDGQTEMMTMGEVMVVASGDHMVSDEQSMIATAAEEATMVVHVDPTVCPLSSFLSADEAVLSPSSGTPMRPVPVTPVTPRRDLLSAAESTPDVAGPECGANVAREASVDHDMDVSLRRKVVGRRLAVVEDDGETQTSRSATSADEDVLTATSSSKARNKDIKRGRRTGKDKDRKYERWTEEGSSEERKRRKKGKKREAGRKDTSAEMSDGKCGEPKGVVEHDFEEMSSSVLGGAIFEWPNKVEEIRAKSRNFKGQLSGEMKKCVIKIKEGTALLVARSEATGDPHFLRMRNTELATQLRETENENARLKEQLRKMSLGPSLPRRKRKVEKADVGMDVAQAASVDLTTPKGKAVVPAPMREEFPPLAQRPPRNMTMRSSNGRVLPAVPTFSTAVCDSEGTETGAEAYFTQHINFLTAARDMEGNVGNTKERNRRDLRRRGEEKGQIRMRIEVGRHKMELGR